MKLKNVVAALALLCAALSPAAVSASQSSMVTPGAPLTMAQLATFLNNALVTQASCFSGATAPAVFSGTPVQYQCWADTSAAPSVVYRFYDGSTWVPFGTLDTTNHSFLVPSSQPVSAQVGTTYTFTDGDRGKLVTQTNAAASAYALPQAGAGSTFVSGWFVDVQNRGAGALTITPAGGSTIDESGTFVLQQGQGIRIVSDGANYAVRRGFGTVYSVGLSLPSIFAVSGSPVTGAGTLTGTLVTQSANAIWAGPATGSAAAPTFRSLVAADVPANLLDLSKISQAAALTAVCNPTGSTANLQNCTAAQMRTTIGVDAETGVGDADCGTLTSATVVVGITATQTATRTCTLPAASALNPGQSITFLDAVGGVSATKPRVIAAAGGDTVQGVASIPLNTPRGAITVSTDGVSKWTVVANTSLGVVTPQMYGALGNDSHDDTTAINVSWNSGYEVYNPAGIYRVTALTLTANNAKIRGAASGTRIIGTTATDTILTVGDGCTNSVSNLVMTDITFWSTVNRTAGYVIDSCDLRYSRFDGVKIGSWEDYNASGKLLYHGIRHQRHKVISFNHGLVIGGKKKPLTIFGTAADPAVGHFDDVFTFYTYWDEDVLVAGENGGVNFASNIQFGGTAGTCNVTIDNSLGGGGHNRDIFFTADAAIEAGQAGNICWGTNSSFYTYLTGSWVHSSTAGYGMKVATTQVAGSKIVMVGGMSRNNYLGNIYSDAPNMSISVVGANLNDGGKAVTAANCVHFKNTSGGTAHHTLIGNDINACGVGTGFGIALEGSNSNFVIIGNTLSGGASGAIDNQSGFSTVQIIHRNAGYLSPSEREKLVAARTYYVATTGSDTANTGLTVGSPFATIQKAYDTIVSTLDTAGFTVTIQVADGTYTTGLAAGTSWTGGGAVTVQGNSSTPANVVISTTSANSVYVTTTLPNTLTIKDMKLTAATSGDAIWHNGRGQVAINNLNFGAVPTTNYHMRADAPGAFINATGNYTISGGAGVHAGAVVTGAVTQLNNITMTITGTPNFSSIFAYAAQAGLTYISSTTFSGSATGTRYLAQLNGMIITNGATLPGNAAGSTATGGLYN
jgi:hypothetical protein